MPIVQARVSSGDARRMSTPGSRTRDEPVVDRTPDKGEEEEEDTTLYDSDGEDNAVARLWRAIRAVQHKLSVTQFEELTNAAEAYQQACE